MPSEIINAVRAKSTIRIVGGAANTHINLSDLSAQTGETVSAAAIAQVSTSTNGIYRIYRGNSATGNLILEICTPINLVLYEYDITFANNATSNIFVEHTGTAGTLVMQLAKTATYSPALTGM
jgi:uncharacterized membrane protein